MSCPAQNTQASGRDRRGRIVLVEAERRADGSIVLLDKEPEACAQCGVVPEAVVRVILSVVGGPQPPGGALPAGPAVARVAEDQTGVVALGVKTAFAEQADLSGTKLDEATHEVMTQLAGTAVPTAATRPGRDP